MENARLGLVALALVVGALAVQAGASGTPGVTEPELTLEESCEPGSEGIDITLKGFPPNTPYTATLQHPVGQQIGPSQFTSGPNGEFITSGFGSGTGTYTITIVWSGGTIQESIVVRCVLTKGDCKAGGWRQFQAFKNQGQCIAFARRGPKGDPKIYLDSSCSPTRECSPCSSTVTHWGGFFRVSNLEPSTEYHLRYSGAGSGGFSFTTNGAGAAQAGGTHSTEGPFEVGVQISRDGVIVVDAHFTVDRPCEDIFPD